MTWFFFYFTSLTLDYWRFDVVLDCTGRTENFPLDLLRTWSNAKYVTLSPPALKNFDTYGPVAGVLKNGFDLLSVNSSALVQGQTLRWAFFAPNHSALNEMAEYLRKDQVSLKNFYMLSVQSLNYFVTVACSYRQRLPVRTIARGLH